MLHPIRIEIDTVILRLWKPLPPESKPVTEELKFSLQELENLNKRITYENNLNMTFLQEIKQTVEGIVLRHFEHAGVFSNLLQEIDKAISKCHAAEYGSHQSNFGNQANQFKSPNKNTKDSEEPIAIIEEDAGNKMEL